LEQTAHAAAAELAGAKERLRAETAQREQAEAKLQRERSLMDIFMQSVPDAVYFKDEQSRFVRCSDSLARSFGKKFAGLRKNVEDIQNEIRSAAAAWAPVRLYSRSRQSSICSASGSACKAN